MQSTFFVQVSGKSTLEKEDLQGIISTAVAAASARLSNHGANVESISINTNEFTEPRIVGMGTIDMDKELREMFDAVKSILPKKEDWKKDDDEQSDIPGL